jgi:archaellum component FlaC
MAWNMERRGVVKVIQDLGKFNQSPYFKREQIRSAKKQIKKLQKKIKSLEKELEVIE